MDAERPGFNREKTNLANFANKKSLCKEKSCINSFVKYYSRHSPHSRNSRLNPAYLIKYNEIEDLLRYSFWPWKRRAAGGQGIRYPRAVEKWFQSVRWVRMTGRSC